MLVKFFKNKGGGSPKASMAYLLKEKGRAEAPAVLQGDPDLSLAIAEASPFKNAYTVGCLSFEEVDLPGKDKQEIMQRFEETLFAGLESEQYNISWVEHRDKGRLELNFFIPNTELSTGKRLQPYYDRADRHLTDNFKKVINHEYGLSDPDSIEKKQLLQLNSQTPKSVNETKKEIA
ncbi:relaxase/mobilization nuclease domain-containing protein, partial [Proteus mirabilis]